jgi:hypothetical protein
LLIELVAQRFPVRESCVSLPELGADMNRMVLASCVVVFSVQARAAEPLPEKDVAAVRAVVEGVASDAGKKDWTAYAKRMDPAGLKSFRDNWVPLLNTAAKNGRDNDLLVLFDGARDVKTALAWTPEEFFARFMKGSTQAINANTEGKTEVIGVVAEGKNVAHVVVRLKQKVPAGEHAVVDVMTVRKTDAGWKVDLPKELTVVAAVIRAQGAIETDTITVEIPPEKK